MRTILFGLALLFAAPAAQADEAAQPWSLEWSRSHYSPGDAVWFKVSYTNHETDAVRVPAGLLEGLKVSVTYHPRPPMGRVGRSGPMGIRPKNLPKASTIEWRTVQPGESVEHHGRLADELPQCKKGCPPGYYEIALTIGSKDYSELAEDQRIPPTFYQAVKMTIEPHAIAVRDPSAMELVVKARGGVRDKKLPLELRVFNRSRFPIWVPNASWSHVLCHLDYKVGGEQMGTRAGFGVGGQSPYGTESATLVRPGKSVKFQHTCTADLPEGATEAQVILDFVTFSVFKPEKRVDAPHFLDATLTSKPLPLP